MSESFYTNATVETKKDYCSLFSAILYIFNKLFGSKKTNVEEEKLPIIVPEHTVVKQEPEPVVVKQEQEPEPEPVVVKQEQEPEPVAVKQEQEQEPEPVVVKQEQEPEPVVVKQEPKLKQRVLQEPETEPHTVDLLVNNTVTKDDKKTKHYEISSQQKKIVK
jgi:hypothetical protein